MNTRRVIRCCVVYAMSALPVIAAEGTQSLSSKEQGWAVRFTSPVLDQREVTSSEIRYRFFGRTKDGFFLSLHVEPFFDQENQQVSCREQYIVNDSSFLDIVDLQSIQMIDQDIQEVHYNARVQYKNTEYLMPNTHYYFSVNGHCADLHFGATPIYDAKHEKSFDQLGRELKDSLFISAQR